jgi:hypothetical protein
MKIVDAFWEKRNLSVNTIEITLENSDSLNDVVKNIESLLSTDVQYLVVKVPISRVEINSFLNINGFCFIECLFNVELDVKKFSAGGLLKRVVNRLNYNLFDSDDLVELKNELESGIFENDRISCDEKFGKQKAARRYINWIEDEMRANSEVFKVLHNDQSLGFFTLKETDNGNYYPFLAGLYSKYSNSGLGGGLITLPILEVQKRGGSRVSTIISSNNMAVLRTHISLGYTIINSHYVFVKHL